MMPLRDYPKPNLHGLQFGWPIKCELLDTSLGWERLLRLQTGTERSVELGRNVSLIRLADQSNLLFSGRKKRCDFARRLRKRG